jgi:hypothetical protein
LRDSKNAINGSAETSWSSSSSTADNSSTPPLDAKAYTADESSPLIDCHLSRKHNKLWAPHSILKSWMQYQPSPIPVFNKTLPPNSVSLFVLAFLAMNAFYNFYRIPLQMFYLFVFADRCGMLFVANLPLLYLLSAKNQPITFLTGFSYETLNIFHRRVGELLCFEALLHFLGMNLVWYGLLRRLGFTLAKFLFNRVVGLGLGAFIAYEVLYFTSLGSFRRKCYEIFLATHIFLQFAGLVLLFLHHRTSRPYVVISLLIFIVDRVVYRLWLKSSTHPATLTVLDDQETLLLSSDWDVKSRNSALVPRSMRHGWEPNDHIFLTIPSLSRKHNLQAHPFTIFSAAPTDNRGLGPEHAWFSLLIRAQADNGFTRALLNHAYQTSTIHIRLDGPYGSSHALDILERSDNAIIVAGGSGIAVAYPLLWALLRPTTPYSDPESGRTRTIRRVKLLWITHCASHRSWLPEDKLRELEEWGLQVLLPAPTSEVGRPDVRKILANWIEGENTGVVVSGPEGLVRDVRNTCASLIRHGELVSVQVEKFGW